MVPATRMGTFVGAVMILLGCAASAQAALIYNFDDGTLQDWTNVGTAGSFYFTTRTDGDGGPHSPPYLVGINDWGARDGTTDVQWLRSPLIKLDSSGDLTFYLRGGTGAGVGALPQYDFQVSTTAGSASGSGFLGVALRDAATGEFVLKASRSGSGGDWAGMSFTAAQLAPYVAAGGNYTVELIDTFAGGWGWIALDTMSVPGVVNDGSASLASAAAGDWNQTGTWNPAQIPAAIDTVTVSPHAVTVNPALSANPAVGRNLTISGGGSVHVMGTQSLSVGGTLNTAGGTLSLNAASTLNLGTADTSASLAGLNAAAGATVNVSNLLTVNSSAASLAGTNLAVKALTVNNGASFDTSGLAGFQITGGGVQVANNATFNLTKGVSTASGLTITGGASLNVASDASLTVTGGIGGINGGTLRVSGGTFTAPNFDLGHDGQTSAVIVEGNGRLRTNGELLMGRNMGSAGVLVRGDGILDGTGQTLRMGRDNRSCVYVGLLENASATFSNVIVGASNNYNDAYGASATLEIGGNASLTTNSMIVSDTIGNNRPGTHPYRMESQVYQSGGTVTVHGALTMARAKFEAVDELTGTYNLAGGTLKTNQINNGSASIPGTARFNFHGGILEYNGAGDQGNFIQLGAGGAAFIYEGATINDGGRSVTLHQPLLTPNVGNGLASIEILSPIGSYLSPPEVWITGGDGTGATAIANLNGTGQVVSITVTNPGVGYTVKPTVYLNQRGGRTTIADASVILASNDYTGGLAKFGAGVLTLSGQNTYRGATTVSEGTLALSHASGNNVAESSLLHVGLNATLDVTALGGGTLALASGQGLRGDGTVDGNVILGGGFLAPGSEAGTGTLAFLDNLDISGAGAGALKFRLGDLASADFDHVDMGGNLLIGDGVLGWDHFEFTPLDGFRMGTYELFGGNVVGSLSGQISGTVGGIPAYLELGSLNLVIVPEPGTPLLIAIGLAGLLLVRRRW